MFTNPIATQTQAGASAPAPVVNESAGTVLSAIGSGMEMYANWKQQEAAAAKAAQPDAYVVQEEWKSEGYQAGLALAEEYQTNVKLNGRAKADIWFNREVKSRQKSLGYTGAQAFQDAISSYVGKNSDVDEREAEMARQNTREAKLQELELQGAELLAGGAMGKVDPATVDRDTLIGLAMNANGRKAIVAQQQADINYQTSQNNVVDRDRKLKSQTQAAFFLADTTNEVNATLVGIGAAMEKNPSKKEELRVQGVAELERKKSQLTAQLSNMVTAGGGNIADIDSTAVQGSITQIDTAIKLLNNTYQIENMDNQLKRMGLSTTLDAVKKLPDDLAVGLFISNTMRTNTDFEVRSAQSLQNGKATVMDSDSLTETIANLKDLGAAAARHNTNVPVQKGYALVWDAAVLAEMNESLRPDAGSTIVSTFMNGLTGNAAVRKDANSNKGLPVLISKMAKKDVSYLADSVEQAAQAEGFTTPQLFIESTTKMFRESVYPSLALSDPHVLTNLNIDYSNGRFNITLNRNAYRTAAKLERNIMPGSGQDLSEQKMDVINQRLARMNSMLNETTLAYKNLGGNPEDIGAAIQYQLQVAAGISKLNQ